MSLSICLSVKLLVYSGTADPVLQLNASSARELCALVKGELCVPQWQQSKRNLGGCDVSGSALIRLCARFATDSLPSPPTCRVMGFTGWQLIDGSVWRGGRIDQLLVRQPSFEALDLEVRRHVLSVMNAPPCAAVEEEPAVSPVANETSAATGASCDDVPILGPDDPSKVH